MQNRGLKIGNHLQYLNLCVLWEFFTARSFMAFCSSQLHLKKGKPEKSIG